MSQTITSRPRWAIPQRPYAHDWRSPPAHTRAVGEAVIIPRPHQLHPERGSTEAVPVAIGDGDRPPITIRRRRQASPSLRPEPATERANEWNWKLIAVAALPVIAGIGLLVLGLDPDKVVVSW